SPYSVSWNTASSSNGQHTLQARARDAAGNLGFSSLINVTVDNFVDITSPNVTVTSPLNNSNINGTITVSAAAADNLGVIGVQFKLDGANLGPEDASSPYLVNWDTTTAANGQHILSATARDAVGNVNSHSVVVNVANAPPPQPSDLVAAYGFNEGNGTNAADSSGNGLTGAISGATWTTGKYGNALQFDGTNDWVTINDNILLDLTNGMTIEAWVKPSSLSGWTTVALKERSGGLAYALYASDGSSRPPAVYANIGGFDSSAIDTQLLALNTWTHIAGTYDGSVLRFYRNGVLVASNSNPGTITTSTGALRIGGNSVWGEYLNGAIDEVRIYKIALTQAEIQNGMSIPIS
ncbi:hypothetical protein HY637_05335, partial [Candidatus Woesearchaeota archaeon]|nr:hypothetical protein [Candidatus Woesearchaeota archaeon]